MAMPLRIPTILDVREIARANFLKLSAEEETDYLSLLKGMVEDMDRFDRLPDPVRSLSHVTRDAGYRPSRDEDPYNALVRRCYVKANGKGKLAGKRLSVKDSISIAGVPLTCGSLVLQGYVPDTDATVIERVLDAGAEIAAITNMDDFAFAAAGETSAYGPTLNPHDSERLAGGSSSGAAAALYYDDIDLSIGCDQGGSIRIPASWCGVVGLKPTHSLVPYTGILGIDATIDHVGPMARNCADAALLLEVMAGPDPRDPRQLNTPPGFSLEKLDAGLKGVRIGILQEGFGTNGADPEVERVVRNAIRILAESGAETEAVSVSLHQQASSALFPVVAEGVTALMYGNGNGHHAKGYYNAGLASTLAKARRAQGDDFSPHLKLTLMLGTYLHEHYHGRIYAKAQNLRPVIQAAYDQALNQVDVLAMPTTPITANRCEPAKSMVRLVNDGWGMLSNTAPFDVTGHPAISIPCGKVGKLPVGLMLVAKHFNDGVLLGIGHAFEKAVAWETL
jgi:amidase